LFFNTKGVAFKKKLEKKLKEDIQMERQQ